MKRFIVLFVLAICAVFVKSQNCSEEPIWKSSILSNYSPDRELIEKRDRCEKHFRNDDGSITAVITADNSLNYKDSRGNWQTVDSRIVMNTTGEYTQYRYANLKSNFRSFYSDVSTGSTLIEFEGGFVKDGINKQMLWLDSNMNVLQSYSVNAAKSVIDRSNAEIMTFYDVFSDIDLKYTQQSSGRKMDYILRTREAVSTAPANAVFLAFAETIDLPKGWFMRAEKDALMDDVNSISIFDTEGKQVALFPIPEYVDANGEMLQYRYDLSGNTIYTLVPIDWILNQQRAFPIVVDPSVTVTVTNSTTLSSGYCNGTTKSTSYISSGKLANGNVVNGWAKIPTNFQGCEIFSEVKLLFYHYGVQGYTTNNDLVTIGQLAGRSGTDIVDVSNVSCNNILNAAGLGAHSITQYWLTPSTKNTWITMQVKAESFPSYIYKGYFAPIWYHNCNSYNGGTTDNPGRYMQIRPNGGANAPYIIATYTLAPPILTASASGICSGESTKLTASTECLTGTISIREGSSTGTVLASTSTSSEISVTVSPSSTKYYYAVVEDNNNATGASSIQIVVDGNTNSVGKLVFFEENFERTENVGYLDSYHLYTGDRYYTSEYVTGSGNKFYVQESANDSYNTKWYINNTRAGHTGYYLTIKCVDYYQSSVNEKNAETYITTQAGSDNIVYWSASSEYLTSVSIDFDWMCGGSSQDYGMFGVHNGTGAALHNYANWIGVPSDPANDQTALLYGKNTWTHFNVEYNSIDGINLVNNPNLSWALFWSDAYTEGAAPAAIYDNIVLSGCPYEGVIQSTNKNIGENYVWTKENNSSTTLTISGTHPLALYQWEKSTVGCEGPFEPIDCAVHPSYTTPSDLSVSTWYRCKVWYSNDGCPGVYQDECFLVEAGCETPILSITNANTNICDDMVLTANVTANAAATCSTWEYAWFKDNNILSSWTTTFPFNYVVDPPTAGTYYIKARCQDDNSCGTFAEKKFTIGSDDFSQSGAELGSAASLDCITVDASGAGVASSGTQLINYLFPDQSFETGANWTNSRSYNNDNYCYVGLVNNSEIDDFINTWTGYGDNALYLSLYNSPTMALGTGDYANCSQNFDFTNLNSLDIVLSAEHNWNSGSWSYGSISTSTIVFRVYVDNRSNIIYTHNAPSANSTFIENVTLDLSSFTGNHTLFFEVYFAGSYSASNNSCINFFLDVEHAYNSVPIFGTITSQNVNTTSLCKDYDCLRFEATNTFPAAGGSIVYNVLDATTNAVLGTTTVSSGTTASFQIDPFVAASIKIQAVINKASSAAATPVVTSWQIKDCVLDPLPVTYLNYNAECVDGGVVVQWSTASEVNADYFIIEKLQGSNFVSIASVKANGTTNQIHEYTAVDNDARNAETFYRIKEVDYDGTYEYTDVFEISCNDVQINYFNAFFNDEDIVVDFTAADNSLYDLSLIDVQGRLVFEKRISSSDVKIEHIVIPNTGFSSGVYTVKLQSAGTVNHKRIVLP